MSALEELVVKYMGYSDEELYKIHLSIGDYSQ